jgi:hypothetical protein
VIVITVELWSAITGRRTVLGQAVVANDGTSDNPKRGNYHASFGRKVPGQEATAMLALGSDDPARTLLQTDRERVRDVRDHPQRRSEVVNFPRKSLSVWHLLCRALIAAGYGPR